MAESLEDLVHRCLNSLGKPDAYGSSVEYLKSEWIFTVVDLHAALNDDRAWNHLKLPTRLKIELKKEIELQYQKPTLPQTEEQAASTANEEYNAEYINEIWSRVYSPEFDCYYFYNNVTQVAQWEEPEELQGYQQPSAEAGQQPMDNGPLLSPGGGLMAAPSRGFNLLGTFSEHDNVSVASTPSAPDLPTELFSPARRQEQQQQHQQQQQQRQQYLNEQQSNGTFKGGNLKSPPPQNASHISDRTKHPHRLPTSETPFIKPRSSITTDSTPATPLLTPAAAASLYPRLSDPAMMPPPAPPLDVLKSTTKFNVDQQNNQSYQSHQSGVGGGVSVDPYSPMMGVGAGAGTAAHGLTPLMPPAPPPHPQVYSAGVPNIYTTNNNNNMSPVSVDIPLHYAPPHSAATSPAGPTSYVADPMRNRLSTRSTDSSSGPTTPVTPNVQYPPIPELYANSRQQDSNVIRALSGEQHYDHNPGVSVNNFNPAAASEGPAGDTFTTSPASYAYFSGINSGVEPTNVTAPAAAPSHASTETPPLTKKKSSSTLKSAFKALSLFATGPKRDKKSKKSESTTTNTKTEASGGGGGRSKKQQQKPEERSLQEDAFYDDSDEDDDESSDDNDDDGDEEDQEEREPVVADKVLIARLREMGFTKQAATLALEETNNHLSNAAYLLVRLQQDGEDVSEPNTRPTQMQRAVSYVGRKVLNGVSAGLDVAIENERTAAARRQVVNNNNNDGSISSRRPSNASNGGAGGAGGAGGIGNVQGSPSVNLRRGSNNSTGSGGSSSSSRPIPTTADVLGDNNTAVPVVAVVGTMPYSSAANDMADDNEDNNNTMPTGKPKKKSVLSTFNMFGSSSKASSSTK